MKQIKLKLDKRSYPISINSDFGNLAYQLKKLNLPNKAIIVTMESLDKLYRVDLIDILDKGGFNVFIEVIPDSESSKSLSQLNISINNITRHIGSEPFFLIAFGGGVVGDLSGFIASIYKRGVRYVQIPTTLLAQVDSSIGGKVGIDLETGKNLVGAFYQPELVYSNISILKTLPDRELQSGMAEVIKYGVIKDRGLFELTESLAAREEDTLFNKIKPGIEEIVHKCSLIKSSVVSRDEKDSHGIRAILNFGHTVGHAIEAASNYSESYTHGEAISIGMLCAVEVSNKLKITKEDILTRLESLLGFYNLPVVMTGINTDRVISAFWYDKKFIKGTPRMVLPVKIGNVKIIDDISMDVVKEVIKGRTR